VYDVVVGSDDNYYYLASINRSSVGSAGTQLAGQQVTVYNSYDPNALDIFLFSTTWEFNEEKEEIFMKELLQNTDYLNQPEKVAKEMKRTSFCT